MKEIILAIEQKHKESGIIIKSPVAGPEIQNFERQIGFELPPDFKEFYSICNGFECTEDIFRMVSIEEALKYEQDYGKNWFHFAEYMIYSDMWSLRKTDTGNYEIFNKSDTEVVLTPSLHKFLQRFLQGNVFEKGGLYDWHDDLKLT
jgi:hypothetical protein